MAQVEIPGIHCGNKQGWLSVSELMQGRRGNGIEATKGNTDIREAYIINEAIYVGIIAAVNAQTFP
jgi:hypothetical protein